MDLLRRISEIDFSVQLGAEQMWMVTGRIRLWKGGMEGESPGRDNQNWKILEINL